MNLFRAGTCSNNTPLINHTHTMMRPKIPAFLSATSPVALLSLNPLTEYNPQTHTLLNPTFRNHIFTTAICNEDEQTCVDAFVQIPIFFLHFFRYVSQRLYSCFGSHINTTVLIIDPFMNTQNLSKKDPKFLLKSPVSWIWDNPESKPKQPHFHITHPYNESLNNNKHIFLFVCELFFFNLFIYF